MELIVRAMLLEPTPKKIETDMDLRTCRLIPSSSDKDYSKESEVSDETGATKDEKDAELTQAEREALIAVESDEKARRNHPLRVIPHPRPHPNDVFFLKVHGFPFFVTCFVKLSYNPNLLPDCS